MDWLLVPGGFQYNLFEMSKLWDTAYGVNNTEDINSLSGEEIV